MQKGEILVLKGKKTSLVWWGKTPIFGVCYRRMTRKRKRPFLYATRESEMVKSGIESSDKASGYVIIKSCDTTPSGVNATLAGVNSKTLTLDAAQHDFNSVYVKIETDQEYNLADGFYSACAQSEQTLCEEILQDLTKQIGIDSQFAQSEQTLCEEVLQDLTKQICVDSRFALSEQAICEEIHVLQDFTKQISVDSPFAPSEQTLCEEVLQDVSIQMNVNSGCVKAQHLNRNQDCDIQTVINSECVKELQVDHGSSSDSEGEEDGSELEFHSDVEYAPECIERHNLQLKVTFSGNSPNQGFFKLFDGFQLTDQFIDADILVVKASGEGNTRTSTPTMKFFKSLLGRKVKIVSKNWVKDSLLHGSVQDMTKYLVKRIAPYGELSDKENFQPFEFKIAGTDLINITEDDVRYLLNTMGGTEVHEVSPETIIICADGATHTAEKCVGKEWIYQSIVDGRIASTSKGGIASTSKERIASTSKRQIASTSKEGIASTSKQQIASTSKERTASASKQQIASTSKEQIASTSKKRIASTSKKQIASSSKERIASTSKRHIPSTSKRCIPSTSKRRLPSTSTRWIASTLKKRIASTSKERIEFTAKERIPFTSKKRIAATSKEHTAATSKERIAATSKGNQSETTDSSGDDSSEQEDLASTPDKQIYLQTSRSSAGKRTQKWQCCLYCNKLQTKISRHMACNHSTEIEVAKILSLPKNSIERRRAWIELESKGNFCHNDRVRESGKGMIIPKKRPSGKRTEQKYIPCEYCKSFFVELHMWRHHKTCVAKLPDVKSDGTTRNAQSVKCTTPFHEHVVSKMPNDSISMIAKLDPLIKHFGKHEHMKYVNNSSAHRHISQDMRNLATFVQAMKGKDKSLAGLSHCLNPQKWGKVISAVRDIAGYNSESQHFRNPSFVLKIGHSLIKCARIGRTKAIDVGNMAIKDKMNSFIDLFIDKWDESASRLAIDSILNKHKDSDSELEPNYHNNLADIDGDDGSNVEQVIINSNATRKLDILDEKSLCQKKDGEHHTLSRETLSDQLSTYTLQDSGMHKDSSYEEDFVVQEPDEDNTPAMDTGDDDSSDSESHELYLSWNCETDSDSIPLENNISDVDIRLDKPDTGLAHQAMDGCDSVSANTVSESENELTKTIQDITNRTSDSCNRIWGKKHSCLYCLKQYPQIVRHLEHVHSNEIDVQRALAFDQKSKERKALWLDLVNRGNVAHNSKVLETQKGEISTGEQPPKVQDGTNDDECSFCSETFLKKDPWRHVKKAETSMRKRLRNPRNKKWWTEIEQAAVKRQLGKYFHLDKLPGKHEIEAAQMLEPLLSKRPWIQIKCFIKNVKVALKRKHNRSAQET
ncbi:uncharacterized protein LOC127865677 isoform X2 [Dreissena polymorpha]|uniref:uncharacterized protein LOC127865677 isoform X2 n=1 Tax=Dreissena polymorpha TaxID=45954 RepID=UPI002264B1AA|nr:uncharacterized protein LOC127865677 isoform X2 [Dreissena polymorpha]